MNHLLTTSALASLLLLALPACSTTPERPDTEQAQPLPPGAVAMIGDTVVTGDDLRAYVAANPVMGADISDNPEAQLNLHREALKALVEEQLIAREAEATQTVPITEDEIDRAIAQVASNNNISLGEVQTAIVEQGYTEQSYRDAIAVQILRSKVVYLSLRDMWGLSERREELIALYKEQTGEQLPTTRTATLSVILIRPESDPDAAMARASTIRSRVLMGADFATLAREVSMSPHASNGGQLGEMREGDLRPEIEAEVFKLDSGGVTPVIEVEGSGYMIFKVHAMSAMPSPEGEQALSQFYSKYQDQTIEAFMTELKERHRAIVADDARLKEVLGLK